MYSNLVMNERNIPTPVMGSDAKIGVGTVQSLIKLNNLILCVFDILVGCMNEDRLKLY